MSDKIITIVRTLNESYHIKTFIETHSFSDYIFIADGGSTDDTLAIARKYPKVAIKEFTEKIERGGTFINHQSHHMQFLIDWATAEGADIILDEDADHEPTPELVRDGRVILEGNKTPSTFVILLWLWGKKYYFPQMNAHDPPDRLFAWRPKELTISMRDTDWSPDKLNIPDPRIAECLRLRAPYAVFHNSWPTVEMARKKMDWNNSVGINYTWPPLGKKLETIDTWQTRWQS